MENFLKKYGKYKWKNKPNRDDCNTTKKFRFTPTQKFVQNYFKPSITQKGILLYHGVGTGKTCAAVAIASKFDKTHNILWVTRGSLRHVMWKNILGEKSCHLRIMYNKKMKGVSDTTAKRRLNKETNHSWYQAITYKQFENLWIKRNNAADKRTIFFKKLMAKNGRIDLLKNTLVIFDEAHNLLGHNLRAKENVYYNNIKNFLQNSYVKSGNESVKVLMLTATPIISSEPESFFKLLNLIKQRKINLRGLIDGDNVSERGIQILKDNSKLISYLDRSADVNIFPQPRISIEEVERSHLYSKTLNQMTNYKKICQDDFEGKTLDSINQVMKNKTMPVDLLLELISSTYNVSTKDTKRYFEHESYDEEKAKELLKFEIESIKDNANFEKNNCKTIKKKSLKKKCIADINKWEKNDIKYLKDLFKEKNQKRKIAIGTFKILMRIEDKKLIKECIIKGNIIKKSKQNIARAEDNKENVVHRELLVDRKYSNRKRHKYYDNLFANRGDGFSNNNLQLYAPKVFELFDKIKKINSIDMKKYGHTFKHGIFYKGKGMYGMTFLISAFMARDFTNYFKTTVRQVRNQQGNMVNRTFLITNRQREQNNTFMALTTPQFKKIFSKKNTKTIINKYNKVENKHGKDVKYLIFDENFIEGIDIMDTKYLHVLSETFDSEKDKQLYGRVLRACGHKNLKYNNGWKVDVILYRSISDGINVERMHINPQSNEALNQLKKHIINSAIDKKLQVRKRTKKTVRKNEIMEL